MKRAITLLVTAAAVLAACRRDSESGATVGMTAEEHARMQAGVGAGATDSAGTSVRRPVQLTAQQVAAIGVKFSVVERGPLARAVRTVGQVVPAEPQLADITAKVDGFVEQLFVDATGVAVRRGQPLLALYSPMLVAAQEELLAAKRLAAAVDTTDAEAWSNAQALLAASRRRLVYWDISPGQVERLEATGEVTKTLALTAPFNGAVLEKLVVVGQAVMAGMKLYRIADLGTVWLEGAVFEQDLAFVRVGAAARADVASFPGRRFDGRVSFVWPTVDEQSRTARVRVALANPGGLLKPGMYATLFFDALIGGDVLHVPTEAVVMTGERNLVFVVGLDGALQPRQVVLGPRAGQRFQVLHGLLEGERIVAAASFLVDAESRLVTGADAAAMPGMPGMGEEKDKP